MNRATPAYLDLRGFRWRLAPLERKWDHELQLARLRLGGLRGEVQALQVQMKGLQDRRSSDAQAAAALLARNLDPQMQAHALRHLLQAGRHLARCVGQAEVAQERVAAAMQVCLGMDRKLACARRLRDDAEAAFAAEQRRRDAKEADLVWLANHGRARGVQQPPKEGTP